MISTHVSLTSLFTPVISSLTPRTLSTCLVDALFMSWNLFLYQESISCQSTNKLQIIFFCLRRPHLQAFFLSRLQYLILSSLCHFFSLPEVFEQITCRFLAAMLSYCAWMSLSAADRSGSPNATSTLDMPP